MARKKKKTIVPEEVPETPRTAFDSEPETLETPEEYTGDVREWPNFDQWRRAAGMLENTGKEQGQDVPRDEFGRILPGHSLNPAGRPLGAENFKTIFEKALKEVAKLNKLDPEDLHAQIIAKGIQSARKGDFRFYKDLLDRLYGRPKEKIGMDLTTGGMPIQGGNQITFVHFENDTKG